MTQDLAQQKERVAGQMKFLSRAIGKLMTSNDDLATAGRLAGRLRRRRPVFVEEITDVRDPGGSPLIRWSVILQSREDALEFDGAVLRLARAVSEEEE
jgi:hypothetical protein